MCSRLLALLNSPPITVLTLSYKTSQSSGVKYLNMEKARPSIWSILKRRKRNKYMHHPRRYHCHHNFSTFQQFNTNIIQNSLTICSSVYNLNQYAELNKKLPISVLRLAFSSWSEHAWWEIPPLLMLDAGDDAWSCDSQVPCSVKTRTSLRRTVMDSLSVQWVGTELQYAYLQ